MTRVLKRPMFRLGGNTDQGIMSGVVPRQGYKVPGLVDQLNIPELQKVAKQYAYKPRGVTPADALIEFGLNVASAEPRGSIFATAADAAKEPFQRYSKSKAESEAARYVSEADMFKTLIGAQADVLGGEGGAKWQKQWEAEQIPGLVNRISELEGRDDLSKEEKNELRSKRILLDKYSPTDEFAKFFLAQEKIAILDLKYVLNQSKAGKGAQDFLKKSYTENVKKFQNVEASLKKEEADLLSKKTLLSKEDYTKKSDTLRKKVIDYKSQRRAAMDKITTQRTESRDTLLKSITPILETYIKENNISVVINKVNTLGGNPENDITKIIVDKLDKVLPSLDLK